MTHNLHLAYGIILGLNLLYAAVLLARFLRVRTKAAPLWPQD